MEFSFKSPLIDDWTFSIEATQSMANHSHELWLHCRMGPASAGTFITKEQAISIGNAFLTAAQQSEVEEA